jgi:hypothetical protein
MEQGSMASRTPLDEDDKRRLIIRLVTRLRCAECGRLYDAEDFVLVQRLQDVWVLSTRCRHCDDPCHVVVYMRLDAEPEPVIDLTPEEAKVAEAWPPITVDDVLDTHLLLREFDGNFEALLAC